MREGIKAMLFWRLAYSEDPEAKSTAEVSSWIGWLKTSTLVVIEMMKAKGGMYNDISI